MMKSSSVSHLAVVVVLILSVSSILLQHCPIICFVTGQQLQQQDGDLLPNQNRNKLATTSSSSSRTQSTLDGTGTSITDSDGYLHEHLALPVNSNDEQLLREERTLRTDYSELLNQFSNEADKVGEEGGDKTEEAAISIASTYIQRSIKSRLTKLFSAKVKSSSCRAKITHAFHTYISAVANEEPLPFSQAQFTNECQQRHPDHFIHTIQDYNSLPENVTTSSLMNTTYQPPRNESLYIDEDRDLILLYGILTHGGHNATHSTIRLIDSLHYNYRHIYKKVSTQTEIEEGDKINHQHPYKKERYTGHSIFVIHVDGKEESDDSYHALVEYAKDKDYVHIIPNEHRVRVNWGGFNMVNATLQILQYSFGLLSPPSPPLPPSSSSSSTYNRDSFKIPKEPLHFHKFVHLASSTYPIKSNTQIRQTVSSYPLDANLFYIAMKPLDPHPATWQYFVECDDAVHRIYRLHPLSKRYNNIQQYMGSQWFIASFEFTKYLAMKPKRSFVREYMHYAKHIIIADEGFFSTVLRHSKFCMKHHNHNFLHLHFDRWESDLENAHRDERKCLMPDPDKCGRSPTTLTKDYMFAFDMTQDLFARKFSDEKHNELKDILDTKRVQEEDEFHAKQSGNYTANTNKQDKIQTSFQGHGTLIVAKDTMYDHNPLCLGLGNDGNKVKLVPCFHREVLETLAPDWATGAVIQEEVLSNNRWEVGPCSKDGGLKRDSDTAQMIMTSGLYSQTGPHCMIKQLGGLRNGRCIDIEGERVEPGGELQVWPCVNKWHQMFVFGDGKVSRNATIFGAIPNHIIKALQYKGVHQHPYLCFGVVGRSEVEYSPWNEDTKQDQFNTFNFLPKKTKQLFFQNISRDRLRSLRLWGGKQLVTMPCNDTDAIIDFLFVPFIVEDDGYGEVSDKSAMITDHDEL